MWNHNVHFHDYLLCQLPPKIDCALDVGCGWEIFTCKLAQKAKIVDAIDVDEAILKQALAHHNATNINYQNATFINSNLSKNSYDVIISIASLHHMDLATALSKIKLLLCPSGKLIILGLYRETSFWDYFYSVISVPLNLIYLKLHRTSNLTSTVVATTYPAQLSFNQIKLVATRLIPGCKIQRHLFWRYSLIWQKC